MAKKLVALVLYFLLTSCSSSNEPLQVSTDNSTAYFSDSEVLSEKFDSVKKRDMEAAIDDDVFASVVQALNDYSIKLHQASSNKAPEIGSVQSGYSPATVLTLANASAGTDTYQALINLLGFDGITEADIHTSMRRIGLSLQDRTNDKLVLLLANRVFIKQGLY